MAAEQLQANIDAMNEVNGFDVVIVCTSTDHQAAFWSERLRATAGQVAPASSVAIAVSEDWPGGAGNGLGTLYAVQKAAAVAQAEHGLDLLARLREGAVSVAVFHTAGKGTRLAPLPGSENNNKPGVKLPAMTSEGPLTILEGVIKQTGVYAPSRKGRLSVFWGDQVFIPSAPVAYTPTHHADILASMGPMLTEEEWAAKGMEKYGLIARNSSGDAAQVEKVTHAQATELLSTFGELDAVGTSLGSFSVSAAFLDALLQEYAGELAAKQGKFDADPHFWMPLTLTEESYVQLMRGKGVAEADALAHHQRMRAMAAGFLTEGGMPLFGAVDVGSACYWWDFGQLHLYKRNNALLTADSAEGAAMRGFYGVADRRAGSDVAAGADVDAASAVLGSRLGAEGTVVRDSVLTGVAVQSLDVENCILVNVTARRVRARNAVLYNIVDDSDAGVELEDGAVMAGVCLPPDHDFVMRSRLDVAGGAAWGEPVCGNERTFADVYALNADANVAEIEATWAARREEAVGRVFS